MRTWARAVVAIFSAAVITVVLAYVGAIVLLVARMGIPLGSEGREPTPGEYAALLLIAGGAAGIGGHIAAGIAHHHTRSMITVLAALLAGAALWGFTSEASQWPTWWAPTLAAVVVGGTWIGGAIVPPRHRAVRKGP